MDTYTDQPYEMNTTNYAGFGQRLVAFLIDWLIISAVSGVFAFILSAIGIGAAGGLSGLEEMSQSPPDELPPGLFAALIGGYLGLIAFSFIGSWLYYALMESSYRQATLGKMAMGIIVTDMNGERISFLRATGRYFGKIISSMILYIGYLMAAFTERKQALHDMMASTLVLKG